MDARPDLPDISQLAALLADAGRARMLQCLLGGRRLPASELALLAGLSAQSASNHLARLLQGGVIRVQPQGRHRYYELAGPAIAHAVEALTAAVAPAISPRVKGSPALMQARSCYDHLAGRLGVAVTDALLQEGHLRREAQGLALTDGGGAWFRRALDIDAASLPGGRRPLLRPCLDWSERRDHLAGALGAALLQALLARGWLRRQAQGRALTVDADGLRQLRGLLPLAF